MRLDKLMKIHTEIDILGTTTKILRSESIEENELNIIHFPFFRTKFKGIASHPSFRAAIQQSFATTTTNTAAILNTVSDNYYYGRTNIIIIHLGPFTSYSNNNIC